MASLPIALLPAPQTTHRADSTALVGRAAPARLSQLEWSVVAMAEQDGVSSLREPGRFGRFLTAVFGVRPPNKLANERLEALRRVAVLAWRYRWDVSKSELANFFAAGFTPDHYELLQAGIGQARAARNPKTVR